ncbi:uncharacterized protein PADG_06463 [Paracoccidioides brasiliensis Pb18]|uniref:Uncharacterized protein n=1 Tax=Paracoccidioides brasiliensis (strain Pb18) TaxID=502780 RepID=C1GGM6_PARBD|nr:uncharacterized protein PADG_06463 [Paracoccidioides brasiliensis Pb18]EEH50384.2 hypothetical protein PADG_06463 [Paracoccidioides brasiliensis Pb18]
MGHGTRAAEIRGRNTPEEEKMGMISVARHGFLKPIMAGLRKSFSATGKSRRKSDGNSGHYILSKPVGENSSAHASDMDFDAKMIYRVDQCGNASPSNSIIASAPWAWKFRFAPKYTMGGSPRKSN